MFACPFCGVACDASLAACPTCNVSLESLRCRGCYHLRASGARSCERCGTERPLPPYAHALDAPCPRCDEPLGEAEAHGGAFACGACAGFFVTHERLAELLTTPGAEPPTAPFSQERASDPGRRKEVRAYVPCPQCHTSMSRRGFGRRSGIVVDVCSLHGTWFDPGELPEALRFAARGGQVVDESKVATAVSSLEGAVLPAPVPSSDEPSHTLTSIVAWLLE
jgi:Zn-finger nucleic acid-binding protein